MNKDFDKALKFVLRWEGFISDDPHDTGGLTIWGISAKSHKKAVLEMKRLIDEGKKSKAFEICKVIYFEVYWLKAGCDTMTEKMSMVHFDTAVNMGRGRANKLFAETVVASNSGNWKDYLLRRLYTYSKFKQAPRYFRGWANRVLDLWKFISESS